MVTAPSSSARRHTPESSDRAAGRSSGAGDEAVANAMALIQLSGVVQGTFARMADRYGLTPVLLAEGSRGMAELAQIFGVGKASLTGQVDRAAQRGLVERSAVPGDRRAVQVVLTDDGRRAAREFHAAVTVELSGFLDSLSQAQRAGFRDAAATVSHAAGHPGVWGPCRSC
jgi:DNA-binding MarR family transcriptional regulator